MRLANERWHYRITPSLIGWAHARNDLCSDSKDPSVDLDQTLLWHERARFLSNWCAIAIWINITVMSHFHHRISNHWQLDCLSNNLFKLTSNNEIQAAHYWPFARETLLWRHNGHNSVSNHQPYDCLLRRLFRRRSKQTSKLRVTGLCAGNSPGPVNFPHKWSVTRKMFPFDDVIMQSAVIRGFPSHK